jgi:hypothetical protein
LNKPLIFSDHRVVNVYKGFLKVSALVFGGGDKLATRNQYLSRAWTNGTWGIGYEAKECLASHIADAAVRLHRDGQATGGLKVCLQTNPYLGGLSSGLPPKASVTGGALLVSRSLG